MNNLDKEVAELLHRVFNLEEDMAMLKRWCIVNGALVVVMGVLLIWN